MEFDYRFIDTRRDDPGNGSLRLAYIRSCLQLLGRAEKPSPPSCKDLAERRHWRQCLAECQKGFSVDMVNPSAAHPVRLVRQPADGFVDVLHPDLTKQRLYEAMVDEPWVDGQSHVGRTLLGREFTAQVECLLI
jgi:hypothetical protein